LEKSHTKLLAGQLGPNRVLIITTRHRADNPGFPPAIPPGVSFAYESKDLGGLYAWIHDEGGGLLLFVNHSAWPPITETNPPSWPIHDIQLAAALGITTVFASIPLGSPMSPNPDAPPAIIDGVASVEAWDSGGIVPVMSNGSGTILIPLPTTSTDVSGLGYKTADLAFAVLYMLGKGKVIVIGHSGITGNYSNEVEYQYPSTGQIDSGDNLKFLMNCVAYLAGSPS
jgi:hypothetical protein